MVEPQRRAPDFSHPPSTVPSTARVAVLPFAVAGIDTVILRIGSATGRRKPEEASRADGGVSEESHAKRLKVPVDSLPKAHT